MGIGMGWGPQGGPLQRPPRKEWGHRGGGRQDPREKEGTGTGWRPSRGDRDPQKGTGMGSAGGGGQGPPPEGAGMGTGMGWGPQRGRGMGTGSLKRGQRPPERDRSGVPIGGKDPPHPIAVGQRIHPVELQALGGQLGTEAHVARRDVHGDGAAPKEHLHGDPLCGAGKGGGGHPTARSHRLGGGGGHPTAWPPWILAGGGTSQIGPIGLVWGGGVTPQLGPIDWGRETVGGGVVFTPPLQKSLTQVVVRTT